MSNSDNGEEQMDDFLYRLRNIDGKLVKGKKEIEDLATKIEFTFLMLANDMAYLDSEDRL
jgi:hypothetical protein